MMKEHRNLLMKITLMFYLQVLPNIQKINYHFDFMMMISIRNMSDEEAFQALKVEDCSQIKINLLNSSKL